MFDRLFLCLRQRIVFRQQVKVYVPSGAHWLGAAAILIVLRRLPGQAGGEEAVRMLQIADQFDAAVMSTAHAQTNGHFAILGRNRVYRHHLDSTGQHILQVHHDRGPGESFLGKDLI